MAKALAECGAKVAIIDKDGKAAETVAAGLQAEGLTARAFATDVLDRASLEATAESVRTAFGPCDLLINGAGGNHPKGTTTKEWLDEVDLQDKTLKTFFDLDPEGIEFVFRLNIMGTMLASQVFGRQMLGRKGCSIINISSMNAFRPLTKIRPTAGPRRRSATLPNGWPCISPRSASASMPWRPASS